MVRGDLHRGRLELQQFVAKIRRNLELPQAGPRFLGEVVGHLHVDVVWRNRHFPRPAFLDDLRQFLGDVDAPAIRPTRIEPRCELGAGILIHNVHVQLALPREAGKREIAAADVTDQRRYRIIPKQQVQLGVQRVPAKELHDHLASAQLARQPAQASFVGSRRSTNGELLAKALRQFAFQPDYGLRVHAAVPAREPHGVPQSFVWPRLHAHEQPAARAISARPPRYQVVNGAPPAQVEVANAEVRPMGHFQRLAQRR